MNKTIRRPIGDMRQELVFIGQGLNQSQIQKAIDECLLTRLVPKR
ncbi:MAG: hypothetical protein ACI82S_002161 [Patiriisocius sp.]|jgi:hypothetical protein